MDTLSYKTVSANKATVQKEWIIVDATDEVLGRLASKIAYMLRGKHKSSFTPHVDCGDNVIVLNAKKIKLTGKKWTDREHFSHSGYPGGQKIQSPQDLFDKKPANVIEKAVQGMLPKNKLGDAIARNLYIYEGTEHNHEAQQPKKVNLNSIK
ncbi:MAG: 50S ribosomal protein L13 [Bacteroidota bacterium]|nr:50S ribosomal protein L13 [Bacteroidota bacterium]